jgi:K+-sensing histidine kinase KdpD
LERVGECLCGRAVSEGRPFYSRDIVLDPFCTLQECKRAGMRSFAALPLFQGAEVFGVLGLASMAERVFAEQATVLEALAGEIAIGLQNAMLHQQVLHQAVDLEHQVSVRRQAEEELVAKARELARSNAFLATLNQVAARIQSASKLERILEALGAELWELGLVSVVALLDSDDSALVLRYISAPPEILARAEGLIGTQFCGQRLRSDAGLAAEVLAGGSAVFVPDPRAVMADLLPHLSHTPLRRAARRAGVSDDYRAVWIRLAYEDRILGALAVMGPELREGDTAVLSVFASQVAAAFERVRLTQEAAEAEILREVDRLRSEFIGNVSHEIRTPLGLIEIFATSLLMGDVELDTETQHGFLTGICEETERLAAIVDNLLNLSQMEDGRYGLDRHPVDLGQLASNVLATLQIQVVDHRLEHDFPPEPLVVGADPKQIEQVLRNLLSNAIRYSPQGGMITVQGEREADRAVLSIRDEGIGIPAEEQERIFERFYRVDTGLAGEVSGVGLGLAVCQGIVEAHGGQIWVESEPGQGSRFYFTLPL